MPLWGKAVARVDARRWSIDGGPRLRLLPAVDTLLGPALPEDPCRFPPSYKGDWSACRRR